MDRNELKSWAFASTIGAIGLASILTIRHYAIKPQNEALEFQRAYNQALFQYADTNNNKTISPAEQEEFDEKLLNGKEVILRKDGMPVYADGTSVPVPTITKWVREYKPSD